MEGRRERCWDPRQVGGRVRGKEGEEEEKIQIEGRMEQRTEGGSQGAREGWIEAGKYERREELKG